MNSAAAGTTINCQLQYMVSILIGNGEHFPLAGAMRSPFYHSMGHTRGDLNSDGKSWIRPGAAGTSPP
jgi:hypothetical protein